MIIEKKQQDKKSFLFNWPYFESARAGLKYILQLESLNKKTMLLPAISADTKKKENIGNYANNGREYSKKASPKKYL